MGQISIARGVVAVDPTSGPGLPIYSDVTTPQVLYSGVGGLISGSASFDWLNSANALRLGTGAVFDLYNTADKTTNYERLRAIWIGNRAELGTFFGGSGTPRQFRVGAGTTSTLSSYAAFYSQQFPFLDITLPETASGGVLSELFKGTFTGSSGTQTIASVQPTLNQSGTAGYTALDVNITETATGSGTKLLQRWAVGGSEVGKMSNAGVFGAAAGVLVGNSGGLGFASALTSTTQDVYIGRDAADTLALRRSTNAQTFRVYNTYTDASNYERGVVYWNSNVFTVDTGSAGTGSSRAMTIGTVGSTDLTFKTANSGRWQVASSGHFVGSTGLYIRQPTVLVSALPAAGSIAGARMVVSDATVTTYASIVAGGGANTVPVYSDGTNWRIG